MNGKKLSPTCQRFVTGKVQPVLQRPLIGEPLGLDLVNTRWVDRGRSCDLFDEPGGVESWLCEHRFVDSGGTVLPAVEAALREARVAVRDALDGADDATLNAVLARGAVRRRVRDGVVSEHVDVAEHWLPAWRAAASYVDLLADRPERIRRCAHPACVLYFYDTTTPASVPAGRGRHDGRARSCSCSSR